MSYPYQSSGYPNPADLYRIRLLKHTGALIFWQQQTVTCTGTLEQCEAAYRDAQTHNLLAGWWSLVSALVMNWIALFSNLSAIRKLRNLAQQTQQTQQTQQAQQTQQTPAAAIPPATPPGWYRDPAGPGQRYWDGAGWTHWTHPPSHR